jgi:hypothetical protein
VHGFAAQDALAADELPGSKGCHGSLAGPGPGHDLEAAVTNHVEVTVDGSGLDERRAGGHGQLLAERGEPLKLLGVQDGIRASELGLHCSRRHHRPPVVPGECMVAVMWPRRLSSAWSRPPVMAICRAWGEWIAAEARAPPLQSFAASAVVLAPSDAGRRRLGLRRGCFIRSGIKTGA